MARIRSVHPGLFTDEAFVVLSNAAQMFLIGLLTEADDQGIFEWKPITLRMRLRPTKDGDVTPLLSELEAGNFIKKYEVEGRQYGVLRNFRKFQKPKSPNATHPRPYDWGNYVGLSSDTSEVTTDEPLPIPPNGEIAPQMEEGGGRGEGEEKKTTNVVDSPPREKANGKQYAFKAKHIRLTDDDFNRWQESFPHLSLRGELESLDAWAGDQGKNWFKAVAGALAKRERQIVERSTTERDKDHVTANLSPKEKSEAQRKRDWEGII